MYSFKSFYFHCSTQEQLPLLQFSSLGCYHFTVAAATHTTLNTTTSAAFSSTPLFIYLKLLQAASATVTTLTIRSKKIQVNKLESYGVHALLYFRNITPPLRLANEINTNVKRLFKDILRTYLVPK